MAAIDKCYVSSYKDYKDFCNWAKGKSFTTPRGEKVIISRWIYNWDEENFADNTERPIFNTPTCIDNYLYHNCPLQFIQDWLKDSYCTEGWRKGNPEDIESDMLMPVYEPCTKVKIVKKGPANHPYKIYNHYTRKVIAPRNVTVKNKNDESYASSWDWADGVNSFVRQDEYELWTCSAAPCMSISIKSIIRKILKTWKLPKGCIVTVEGRYVGDEWILETK